MNQSPRFSSTQFRPVLQFFFAPGEILAPEQTLSFLRRKVASLQFQLALPRRGGVLDLVGLNERGEQLLGLFDLWKFRRRRKTFERGRKHGVRIGGAILLGCAPRRQLFLLWLVI